MIQLKEPAGVSNPVKGFLGGPRRGKRAPSDPNDHFSISSVHSVNQSNGKISAEFKHVGQLSSIDANFGTRLQLWSQNNGQMFAPAV